MEMWIMMDQLGYLQCFEWYVQIFVYLRVDVVYRFCVWFVGDFGCFIQDNDVVLFDDEMVLLYVLVNVKVYYWQLDVQIYQG